MLFLSVPYSEIQRSLVYDYLIGITSTEQALLFNFCQDKCSTKEDFCKLKKLGIVEDCDNGN